MGIRHLQSYICRDVPNGHLPVDIKEEVDNWKRYKFLLIFTEINLTIIIIISEIIKNRINNQ